MPFLLDEAFKSPPLLLFPLPPSAKGRGGGGAGDRPTDKASGRGIGS